MAHFTTRNYGSVINRCGFFPAFVMAMAFNVFAQPIPQPVRHIPNFQPIDRCTELFQGSGQPDASKLQVTYLREGLRRKYVRKFLTTCYRYIRNADVSYEITCGNGVTYSGTHYWEEGSAKTECWIANGEPAGSSSNVVTSTYNSADQTFGGIGMKVPIQAIFNQWNGRKVGLPSLSGGAGRLAKPVLFVHGYQESFWVFGANSARVNCQAGNPQVTGITPFLRVTQNRTGNQLRVRFEAQASATGTVDCQDGETYPFSSNTLLGGRSATYTSAAPLSEAQWSAIENFLSGSQPSIVHNGVITGAESFTLNLPLPEEVANGFIASPVSGVAVGAAITGFAIPMKWVSYDLRSTDIRTNFFARARTTVSWKKGWVESYRSGSPPYIMAFHEKLNTAYDPVHPQLGINDNGIHFWSSRESRGADELPVFWGPTAGNSQSRDLYNRITEVLDRHYGTGWTANASSKIDLVCHSQGCLVLRELLRNAATTGAAGAANPANHIEKVISVNAPHFGTAIATASGDLPPGSHNDVRDLKDAMATDQRLVEGVVDIPTLSAMHNTGLTAASEVMGWFGRTGQQVSYDGDIAELLFGTVLGGVAGLVTYIGGAVCGTFNEVRFDLNGPILGPYRMHTVVDPGCGFPDEISNQAFDPVEGFRGYLNDFIAGSSRFSQTSPWIIDLTRTGFPRKPDGTPVMMQPMFSSDVRGLEAQILGELGFGVSQVCDDKTRSGCLSVSQVFGHEAAKSARASASAQDFPPEIDGVDLNLGGSMLTLLRNFREGWMSQSDLVVEAQSQQMVDVAAGFNPADPQLAGFFMPPRTYDYNIAHSKGRIPEAMTVHGPFSFREKLSLADDERREVILDNEGATGRGIDIYCALQGNCGPLGQPGAVVLKASTQAPVSGLPVYNGSGAPTLRNATRNPTAFQGDFNVALISGRDEFQGMEVREPGLASPRIVLATEASAGTYLHYIDAGGNPHSQLLLAPQIPAKLQLQRVGNLWRAVAAPIQANPVVVEFNLALGATLEASALSHDPDAQQPQLVGVANQVGTSAAPMGEAVLGIWHVETRATNVQVSKPRLMLVNAGYRAQAGFKIHYYFSADSGRNPILEINRSASHGFLMQNLGGGNYRVTIDAVAATIQPHKFYPDKEGFQFTLRYGDGSPWPLVSDWSANRNSGKPAANDHIVVEDAQGRVLFGNPPQVNDQSPKKFLLAAESRDAGNHEGNILKPEIRLRNVGAEPLSGYKVQYIVRLPPGKTPLLEDWYTPNAEVHLLHLENNDWAVEFHVGNRILFPGMTEELGNVGVHFPDWSAWSKTASPSWNNSAVFKPTDRVIVLNSEGEQIYGVLPLVEPLPGDVVTPPIMPPAGPFRARTEIKDEAPGELNYLKPRIRVRNLGAQAIPGFRLRFQIMAESGKLPQLDAPWYVPGCEAGLSKSTGELYSIVYECADAAIQPGAYWPDVSGSVAGIHYPDWSQWNRSNDPVMAGVSGDWSTATAITLETLSGAAIGN